jgi:uncharacterized repeat protein (TIGR01451 family)
MDSVDPVVAGRPLSYTIEVRNVGQLGAEFVRLIDEPDANFTYIGFATTRGSCVLVGSITGGTLDCDLGSLGTGAGAVATITVTGRLAAIVDHDVENTATVDHENLVPESDEGNNSATITTRVMVSSPTPSRALPPPAGTPTPTTPVVQGDVNGDHDINSLDAWWVLLFEVGLTDHLPVPGAGDVSKDGRTDSFDALLILFFDAGAIDLFGPG